MHPGPELRRAAERARQGLQRPGHSQRGRAASQPAPGSWATATWRRPLPIVLYEGPIVGRSRSECAATTDAGRTPGAGAALLAPRGAAQTRLPSRQPCTLPAAHTHIPRPPEPEQRPETWAAWLGVLRQQEAVHGGRTCSCHARELAARGRARARAPGAPLPARPRASRPMIFRKKSANGQSGVYFQSANNDFFFLG